MSQESDQVVVLDSREALRQTASYYIRKAHESCRNLNEDPALWPRHIDVSKSWVVAIHALCLTIEEK